MFAMSWLMMTAMMPPSAAPILLLVAALNRRASPCIAIEASSVESVLHET